MKNDIILGAGVMVAVGLVVGSIFWSDSSDKQAKLEEQAMRFNLAAKLAEQKQDPTLVYCIATMNVQCPDLLRKPVVLRLDQ